MNVMVSPVVALTLGVEGEWTQESVVTSQDKTCEVQEMRVDDAKRQAFIRRGPVGGWHGICRDGSLCGLCLAL